MLVDPSLDQYGPLGISRKIAKQSDRAHRPTRWSWLIIRLTIGTGIDNILIGSQACARGISTRQRSRRVARSIALHYFDGRMGFTRLCIGARDCIAGEGRSVDNDAPPRKDREYLRDKSFNQSDRERHSLLTKHAACQLRILKAIDSCLIHEC